MHEESEKIEGSGDSSRVRNCDTDLVSVEVHARSFDNLFSRTL